MSMAIFGSFANLFVILVLLNNKKTLRTPSGIYATFGLKFSFPVLFLRIFDDNVKNEITNKII